MNKEGILKEIKNSNLTEECKTKIELKKFCLYCSN